MVVKVLSQGDTINKQTEPTQDQKGIIPGHFYRKIHLITHEKVQK